MESSLNTRKSIILELREGLEGIRNLIVLNKVSGRESAGYPPPTRNHYLKAENVPAGSIMAVFRLESLVALPGWQ